jgi:hypothetical protein
MHLPARSRKRNGYAQKLPQAQCLAKQEPVERLATLTVGENCPDAEFPAWGPGDFLSSVPP